MDGDSQLRRRASSVRASVRATLGARATDDESESDAADETARVDDARNDGGDTPPVAAESGRGESPADDVTAPSALDVAAPDGLDGFSAAIERCIEDDLTVRIDVPDDPALAHHGRLPNELFEGWQTAMRNVDAFVDQVPAPT